MRQKIRLLRVAREAVYQYAARGSAPSVEEDDERLKVRQGVFVSLHINQRLRGCMGMIIGDGPLCEAVSQCAVNAASEDPRFAPIRMDEVPKVDIELSVLGPMQRAEADDIEVGTHGIFVTKGRVRGILLPQVATQFNWTSEKFLSETCVKAGLDPEAWRDDDCFIEIFTAEVCCESEMRPED